MTNHELRSDGYFWARKNDGTVLVVLREKGLWYACGVQKPIFMDRYEIIERIEQP